MSPWSQLPCPGPVQDTHQCVVELESTDVVGGDVRSGQGLGDLGHDATLIWGQRGDWLSLHVVASSPGCQPVLPLPSPSLCQQCLSHTHHLPGELPPHPKA